LPPEPKVQAGPNCGFYSLQFVFDYWTGRGHAPTDNKKYTARARDGGTSLRQLGKSLGALHLPVDGGTTPTPAVGGVYRAENLGKTAAQVPGFVARTITAGGALFHTAIQRAIDKDWPCIVALDVNDDGDPVSLGGERAHWGTVVGYFTDGGELHYLATHGHSDQYYDWKAHDLQISNEQLRTAKGETFYKVWRDTDRYEWTKKSSGSYDENRRRDRSSGKVRAVHVVNPNALKITLLGCDGKDYDFDVASNVKVTLKGPPNVDAVGAAGLQKIRKGVKVSLSFTEVANPPREWEVTKISDHARNRLENPDIQMDLRDKIVLVVPEQFRGGLANL
jgi:hypothetical protein